MRPFPSLSDLTERVHRAQAAARLNAELERALGDFEEQLAQGDLPRAGDLAADGRLPRPDRLAGARARKRLEQATAALAAKEAADARQARRRAEDRRGRRASREQAISPAPRTC